MFTDIDNPVQLFIPFQQQLPNIHHSTFHLWNEFRVVYSFDDQLYRRNNDFKEEREVSSIHKFYGECWQTSGYYDGILFSRSSVRIWQLLDDDCC